MFLLNEKLKSGDESSRRRICERLWFELTIAGRTIWSDPALNVETKLEALKWLNEIQHRVWHSHAEANSKFVQDLDWLIAHHVSQAPQIEAHVTQACRASWEVGVVKQT